MYYKLAGWDTTSGMPTRKTLTEVGLSWVADDLGLSAES
jgi:aldehyde:ferredoxin oxidoreductase